MYIYIYIYIYIYVCAYIWGALSFMPLTVVTLKPTSPELSRNLGAGRRGSEG